MEKSIAFSGIVPNSIYCTDIQLVQKPQSDCLDVKLKRYLNRVGSDVRVVQADNILKLHVHTHCPDKVIAGVFKLGTIEWVKVSRLLPSASEHQ